MALGAVFQAEERDEIYKHFKRGVILLILDELETVRRYFNFRWQRLVQQGLFVPVESKVYQTRDNDKETVVLEIKITVTEDFIESNVDQILHKMKRRREKEIEPEEERFSRAGQGEAVSLGDRLSGAKDTGSRPGL